MTDIVERLRAKHDDSWPQQIGQGDLYNQDGPEAADEIERLRAAMRADDERLRKAGERVGMIAGCDTAEWMADEIERLRAGGCARDQHTTQFCGELRAAVKAENEACAKIVLHGSDIDDRLKVHAKFIAARIRARMEAKP